MTPRLPVLIRFPNGEPWAAEAVRSVLRQTFGGLELIVVDGGSKDGTGAILDGQRDPRVRVADRARAPVLECYDLGALVGREIDLLRRVAGAT